MEIMYERVAGIDIGKKIVAVAVRTPGERPGRRHQQVRKYHTFHQRLAEMVTWLTGEGVTHVSMEATGIYWKPVVRHEALGASSPRSKSVHCRLRQTDGNSSHATNRAVLPMTVRGHLTVHG